MRTARGMGIAFDPWRAAAAMKVSVEERSLRAGRRGEYVHSERRIWLAPGLSYRVARATLTHELLHCIAGDVPSCVPGVTRRQEILARRRTAEILVNADEYAESEQLREGWVAGIAIDLDITSRVVLDWQELEGQRRLRAA